MPGSRNTVVQLKPAAARATSASRSRLPDPAPADRQQERWLLGLPSLSRFLDFVEERSLDTAPARKDLTAAWRRANDYYQELERREAGAANAGECLPPGRRLRALFEALKDQSHYHRVFDTLPASLQLVPLGRLIVYQRHVTWSFVERLMRQFPAPPSQERLFELCLPQASSTASVEARKVGSRRYVFRCESTDFRSHAAALLEPGQLSGMETTGAIARAVGLPVGFGCNFLNAIRVGRRLLLNNGYHRACALYALGVTHAPCIVETATRVDEVAAAAPGEVAEDAEFYFESARPPLLKDFFDPGIRMDLVTRRMVREIEISFDVKEYFVPA